MRFIFIILTTIILAGVGWFLAHIIPASGKFAKLNSVLVGECRKVNIAPGTEDVTIDPLHGVAYISAADRRAWFNEDGAADINPKNGIYTLSLDGADRVTKVSGEFEDFLPHGINLWNGPDGAQRLFVVNHPSTDEEIIEIFDVGEDGALTHLESVSFDAMHSPNDVVGVGPRQFYATNDRGYETGPLSVLEAYMALPFSDVVYYDGNKGAVAAKNLTYANGINQSADGKTLYVAEFLKRRVTVFDRDLATGALKKTGVINTGTGPDNIEVAKDGALWVAGHPRVFDFLDHANDESIISPSHVVRIDPATGERATRFMSINGEINGSSVGAAWDEQLIVGAVFDGHVMVCPL